jgi:hypothetical protein
MRVVSRRDFANISSGGSVRMMMSDVMMAIVDVRGVPVRLMTMGSTSNSVPAQWCQRALASEGVYLRLMNFAVWYMFLLVQYFHSPTWLVSIEESWGRRALVCLINVGSKMRVKLGLKAGVLAMLGGGSPCGG